MAKEQPVKQEDCMTFDEWREEGFVVMKGQKARFFNKFGKALFSQDQVCEDEYQWANDVEDLK